jgi:hypothetical protein
MTKIAFLFISKNLCLVIALLKVISKCNLICSDFNYLLIHLIDSIDLSWKNDRNKKIFHLCLTLLWLRLSIISFFFKFISPFVYFFCGLRFVMSFLPSNVLQFPWFSPC